MCLPGSLETTGHHDKPHGLTVQVSLPSINKRPSTPPPPPVPNFFKNENLGYILIELGWCFRVVYTMG